MEERYGLFYRESQDVKELVDLFKALGHKDITTKYMGNNTFEIKVND